MFGIGAGELMVIAIVILIAVGPDRLPTLMKTLGKGMRDVRRTTNELRRSTGIDEILEENDLRDPLGLKKPVPQKKPAPKPTKPVEHPAPAAARMPGSLTPEQVMVEQPPLGVDVAFAESRARAAIVARKLAAAPAPPEPEA